jgi:hypothetical protein
MSRRDDIVSCVDVTMIDNEGIIGPVTSDQAQYADSVSTLIQPTEAMKVDMSRSAPHKAPQKRTAA